MIIIEEPSVAEGSQGRLRLRYKGDGSDQGVLARYSHQYTPVQFLSMQLA